MSKLTLYDSEGKGVGEVTASAEVFGREPNPHVVYSALRWYQASKRRGTHSTKTRAEVRGGGAKPWKQKGTGRARAGSNRSPLWRTGGVIFGPKPRDYGYALPRKVRKLALKLALSDKVREGKFRVVEELKVAEMKTREAQKFLKALDLSGKILILLGRENVVFEKAGRNLCGVKIISVNEINIFDLLNAEWVVTEKSAMQKIEGALKHAA